MVMKVKVLRKKESWWSEWGCTLIDQI